ncbi:MAG: ParA family protein [Gammaproteobacteria bacterium]|nr:ParA family protein [Gammaproteobacteria bacterium]MBL4882767.1 ParA family protein [Oleispira sp.]
MSKILVVANQKGGVGKTTTAVNLSASLAATKRKVLMVDLDPQGNATMGCGIDKHDLELSLYDVLTAKCNIADVIMAAGNGGFDVVPTNSDLTAAEVELMSMPQRETRLRTALAEVSANYDYIIIDCPPSLSMLTVNAMVAAQGVLIPMQCEYYALEGLSALMQTIEKIKSSLNPELVIEGILRTMYDPRNSLTTDVSTQLITHFGDKVYSTVIPRNVRLAEAPSYGLPVLAYDKNSRGAVAYLALAGEMNRRTKSKKSAAKKASTNKVINKAAGTTTSKSATSQA